MQPKTEHEKIIASDAYHALTKGEYMTRRPCDEIRAEIEIVQRLISEAKKQLENPQYDEEQKAMLRFQIEGWVEQLAQLREQLANCD